MDDHDEQQMMIDRVAEEYGGLIEFQLLQDLDHAVIDRYGLFNPDDSQRRAIPHPTTFVIDKQGVVRWRFLEINFRIRPTNEDILAAVAELE